MNSAYGFESYHVVQIAPPPLTADLHYRHTAASHVRPASTVKLWTTAIKTTEVTGVPREEAPSCASARPSRTKDVAGSLLEISSKRMGLVILGPRVPAKLLFDVCKKIQPDLFGYLKEHVFVKPDLVLSCYSSLISFQKYCFSPVWDAI